MDAKAETWCDRDEHKLFEYYVDFNDWLDSEEAASVREAYKVDGMSVPSKAFYARDKAAYYQATSFIDVAAASQEGARIVATLS